MRKCLGPLDMSAAGINLLMKKIKQVKVRQEEILHCANRFSARPPRQERNLKHDEWETRKILQARRNTRITLAAIDGHSNVFTSNSIWCSLNYGQAIYKTNKQDITTLASRSPAPQLHGKPPTLRPRESCPPSAHYQEPHQTTSH